MLDHRPTRLFAATLSATAGFVDAVGWLTTGGLFISFMSGNVTKLGLGLAGRVGNVAMGAGLIGAFVGGVIIGSLAGRAAGPRQRGTVMWLVTVMMTLAALGLELGLPVPAVLILAACMGAANTVFAENGEVRVGLTYMTGALVRIGKRIATAILGGDRLGWVEPATLFLGMLAGATLGGVVQLAIGPRALWLAIAVMLTLTLLSPRLPGRDEDPLSIDETQGG
jgi:uncharacterized membrane protein YoaK (UPF0700 family)